MVSLGTVMGGGRTAHPYEGFPYPKIHSRSTPLSAKINKKSAAHAGRIMFHFQTYQRDRIFLRSGHERIGNSDIGIASTGAHNEDVCSPQPLEVRKQGSGHATSRLAPATPAMLFFVASQFDDTCLALMSCSCQRCTNRKVLYK